MAKPTNQKEWFKNAGHSMKSVSKSLLMDIAPVMTTTFSESRDTLRDIQRSLIKHNQTSRQQEGRLQNSRIGKKVISGYRAAIEDLKTGNFGIRQANNDMFDDWENDMGDTFNMETYEGDAEISSDEITLRGDEAIAKSVIRGTSAQLTAMDEMTRAIVGSNLKATQSSSAQIANTVIYMGNMINKNLLQINSSLGMINKNIATLIDFQRENVAPTNQMLTEYLEESSMMMKNFGEILTNLETSREGKTRYHRFYDVQSGFKPKDYFKRVKSNLKMNPYYMLIDDKVRPIINSLIGADDGTSDEPKLPISGKIVKGITKLAIAPMIKKSIGGLDKNIGKYMQEILYRIGDLEDSFDPILPIIGEIFGTRRAPYKRISLSNYSKEALPWNGIAQKALTEVIPEYLASIDAGINNMEKRYFDYNSGQFKDISKLYKDFLEDRDNTMQISMMKPISELVEILKKQGVGESSRDKILSDISKSVNYRLDNMYDPKAIKKSRQGITDALDILNNTDFAKTFRDLETAIDDFIFQMSQTNQNISTGQNVFRNINNTQGKEAWRSYKQIDITGFVFNKSGKAYDTEHLIKNILQNEQIYDFKISRDPKVLNAVLLAINTGATDDELRRIVIQAYHNANAKTLMQKSGNFFSSLFGKYNNNSATRSISRATREIDEFLLPKAYGIKRHQNRGTTSNDADASPNPSSSGAPNNSPPPKPRAASSVATNRRGERAGSKSQSITPAYQQRRQTLDKLTNQFIGAVENKKTNLSQNEIDSATSQINDQIAAQQNEEGSNTLEGSITQMNNTTRTGFLAILSSFQNLGSSIFGKDGLVHRFFDSKFFKNTLGKIKDYLIGDEKGIFKDQWKKLKAGAKDVWGKAKGHLLNGYDFLYRNTMIHLLGEDYKSSDTYKKLLSKIDFKFKADEKARLARPKIDLTRNTPKTHHARFANGNIKLGNTVEPENLVDYESLIDYNVPEEEERPITHTLPAKKLNEILSGKNGDKDKLKAILSKKNQAKNKIKSNNMDSSIYNLTAHELVINITAGSYKINQGEQNITTTAQSELSNNPFKQKKKTFKITKIVPSTNGVSKTEVVNVENTEDLQDVIANNAAVAATSATNEIRENSQQLNETLFGDPNESEANKKKGFLNKFKSMLPKGIAGILGGAGLSLLSGGSMGLLGALFLPACPIGGAIAGFGTMMLSQTEAFKSILFGKKNEDGERQGGLITKKMADAIKKAAPAAIGGAVLGGIKRLFFKGIAFSGPLGVLTSTLLPGGPLGGAVVGLGLGILGQQLNIKERLFGKKDEDGKRSGGILSNAYNKVTSKMKDFFTKRFGKGMVGAGIGALSGLTLANMGIIPAAFSLGGPIGGAIAGFGLGIASTSKKFQEFVFGTEELDENGNPTGKRRQDGLLGRARNLIMVHFIEPLAKQFKRVGENMVDWVKEAIVFPFRKAFGPIIDSFRGIKDNVVANIKKTFTHIGEGIISIFQNTFKKLFSPLGKVVSFIGKSIANMFAVGTKIMASPLTGGLKVLELLTMGKRRKGYMDFYKNYFTELPQMLTDKWQDDKANGRKRGLFGHTRDLFSAIFDYDNEIKNTARDAWNEQMTAEGKNSLDWRGVYGEQRAHKAEKEQRKRDRKRWDAIDALRQKYVLEFGGIGDLELRDDRLESIAKQFKQHGIEINSSQDLMSLLYDRDSWRKKDKLTRAQDPKGIKIAESPEQIAAQQAQQKSAGYLEQIRDMFRDLAFQNQHPGWDSKTRAEQTEAYQRLKKRARKYNINIDNLNSLSDVDRVDISKLSDEDWEDYRQSKFFESGRLNDWYEDLKKRKSGIVPTNSQPTQTQSKVKPIWTDRAKAKMHGTTPEAEALKRIADTTEASLIAQTGGAENADKLREKAKSSSGRKLFDKFHTTTAEAFQNIKTGLGSVFDGIFRRQKKADRAAELEAAQDAAASGATGGSSDVKLQNGDILPAGYFDREPKVEKKTNILSTIFRGIGGVFGKIGGLGGGKVGTALKVGLGVAGAFGLTSVIFGILNSIFPGFNDMMVEKGEEFQEKMPEIVSNVTEKLGSGLSKLGELITENGPIIYKNFLAPAFEQISNIVVKYGPSFIEHSVQIFTSLIPSIVDAFCRVVPSLAVSLSKGIYDATLGAFWGNKSGTKKVTEDDIAYTIYNDDGTVTYQTEDGLYVTTDPETGELQTTGARVNVGSNGQRTVIANHGSRGATANLAMQLGLGVMRKGSKSAAGVLTRGIFRAVGGAGGGLAGLGLRHPIIGASVGSKITGTVGKGVTNGLDWLGQQAARNPVIASILGISPERIAQTATKTVTGADLDKAILKALANQAVDGGSAAVKQSAQNAILAAFARNGIEGFSDSVENGRLVISALSGVDAGTITKRLAEAGIENTDDALKRAAQSLGKHVAAEGGEVSQTMLEKLLKAMNQNLDTLPKNRVWTKIVEKIAAKFPESAKQVTGKLVTYLKSLVGKVGTAVKNNAVGKWTARIAEKLGIGGVKSFPLITIVCLGWDGITGAIEAKNLFHTNYADAGMRLISGIMKALLGLSLVGAVIDIILEIGEAVMHVDFKQKIATWFYDLFATEGQKQAVRASQNELEIEAEIYNSITGSNLDASAYNDMKNRTVLQIAADNIKATFNPDYKLELQEREEAIARSNSEAVDLGRRGFTREDVSIRYNRTTGPTASQSLANTGMTSSNIWTVGSNEGFGLGYGTGYSQSDRRWKNVRIGTMPNGTPSTMGNGGCGPTALAMAASSLTGKQYNPAAVGKFAASNGYISAGGANAGLFTEGAARLGIGSTPLNSTISTARAIASGNPVILSGKSQGSNDPYTKAGHIVVTDGVDSSGKVRVKDPMDGHTKKYGLRNLLSGSTSGFALSSKQRKLGYGNGAILNKLLGYGLSEGEIKQMNTADFLQYIANTLYTDPTSISIGSDKEIVTSGKYSGGLISLFKNHDNNTQSTFIRLYNIATNKGNKYTTIEQENARELLQRLRFNYYGATADVEPLVKAMFVTGKNPSTKWTEEDFWKDVAASAKGNSGAAFPYIRGIQNRFVSNVLGMSLKDLYNLNTDVNFRALWDAGKLIPSGGSYQGSPLTEAHYIYKWAEALVSGNYQELNEMRPKIDDKTIRITDLINKIKQLQELSPKEGGLGEGAGENIIQSLKSMYGTRIAMENGITPTGVGSTSEIVSELQKFMNRMKLEDYGISINGYRWYDPNDPKWGDFKYAGLPISDYTNLFRYQLTGLASLLSTFTGKPYTPRIVAEYVLPYLHAKMIEDKDDTLPYTARPMADAEGNDLGLMEYIDNNILFGGDNNVTKKFFGLDIFKKIANKIIVPRKAGENISDIKKNLAKNIPYLIQSNFFDGSIFGGNNPPSEDLVDPITGILQHYDPSTDLLQYMSMGHEYPLYTQGKNVFEDYPEMYINKLTRGFQLSDKSVPAFASTEGQIGIRAGGLEAPIVGTSESGEESTEYSGPFGFLKKIISYITEGIGNLFGDLFMGNKRSGAEAMQDAENTLGNGLGYGLGYGPNVTTMKRQLAGSSANIKSAIDITTSLARDMNTAAGGGVDSVEFGTVTSSNPAVKKTMSDKKSAETAALSLLPIVQNIATGANTKRSKSRSTLYTPTNSSTVEELDPDDYEDTTDGTYEEYVETNGENEAGIFSGVQRGINGLLTFMENKIGRLLYGDSWVDKTIDGNDVTDQNSDITFAEPSNISADSMKRHIWQSLKSQGYSDNAIAGIMGCWQEESGNKPNTIEGYYLPGYPGDNAILTSASARNDFAKNVLWPKLRASGRSVNESAYHGADGNIYPGIGLAQWTGPRAYNLLQYAQSKGLNWGSADAQIGMFKKEVSESYSNLPKLLATAQSPEEAAGIVLDNFEMYNGFGAKNPKDLSKRQSHARAIYNQLTADPLLKSVNTTKINKADMMGMGLGYGPGALGYGFEDDFGKLISTMGAAMDMHLNNVDFATAFDRNQVNINGVFSDSSGWDNTGDDTRVFHVSGGDAQQQLVNAMKSKLGTVKYSLSGPQDPDKGSASCASTVAWAYNKVLGFRPGGANFASSTNQSKDNRFTTIYTKRTSKDRPSISMLQPGDILYQNWSNQTNNGQMNHTEMYAGNGQDLSHGGNPSLGPVYKDLNDYRLAHTMMIRRYKGFTGNNMGYGSGESMAEQEWARAAMGLDRSYDTLKTNRFDMLDEDVYYGPGDGTTTVESIREVIRTGKMEDKLDSILRVMCDWYDDSKSGKVGGAPVNVSTTNNTTVLNGKKTVTAKDSASKPQSAPNNERLRKIHKMIAEIQRN